MPAEVEGEGAPLGAQGVEHRLPVAGGAAEAVDEDHRQPAAAAVVDEQRAGRTVHPEGRRGESAAEAGIELVVEQVVPALERLDAPARQHRRHHPQRRQAQEGEERLGRPPGPPPLRLRFLVFIAEPRHAARLLSDASRDEAGGRGLLLRKIGRPSDPHFRDPAEVAVGRARRRRPPPQRPRPPASRWSAALPLPQFHHTAGCRARGARRRCHEGNALDLVAARGETAGDGGPRAELLGDVSWGNRRGQPPRPWSSGSRRAPPPRSSPAARLAPREEVAIA